MSQSKKFIMTQDKSVCDKLVASGFYLLSENCGMYTLINKTKESFNFSDIDTTKIHFTDKLYI